MRALTGCGRRTASAGGAVASAAPAGEIGESLFLSPATIKTHLKNTYEKLGVSDRAAAVAEGMRHGLVE
ncbi:MAG: response regulator transcription factor [Solirubrobacterales bacterium]